MLFLEPDTATVPHDTLCFLSPDGPRFLHVKINRNRKEKKKKEKKSCSHSTKGNLFLLPRPPPTWHGLPDGRRLSYKNKPRNSSGRSAPHETYDVARLRHGGTKRNTNSILKQRNGGGSRAQCECPAVGVRSVQDQEAMAAARVAGNNSRMLQWTPPPPCLSLAPIGFTSPRMAFWPLAGCGSGPCADFLLFLPVLLPRQRLETGRRALSL
ncbi:uncharacterized protein LOC134159845 [Pezoporus occidentalis]|uniref:uncharacterized protein LOC134159845 n=1 Tax=Pezoporus occidentalis TaxID=407982 RepID=UPI002F916F09